MGGNTAVKETEIVLELTLTELWIEAKIKCSKLPNRTQFYKWLQLVWIHKKQPKGGIKKRQTYTEKDLNRIVKFYDCYQETKNLKEARHKLFEEMKKNPNLYFTEDEINE